MANTENYMEQGGERWVVGGSCDVADGGEIDVESGGALKVAGTDVTASLGATAGKAADASFVVGSEAGNVINVAIQLKDADGEDLAARANVYAYLSDDANGDSIAGTAPDGGVAIGTDGIADPITAGKSFRLGSEADGDIDLNITESGADTWYLVVVLPDGSLKVSGAITFAT